MFDMVMNMSVNEIIILNELLPVAKEAKEAAELIRKTYHSFGIGEEKIEVWHDCENNYEYLTRDGVWQARYLHQTYDIKCSEEEIFKYFKAEYLVENGFVEECTDNGYLTEEGNMRNICRYFKVFLSQIRGKQLEDS